MRVVPEDYQPINWFVIVFVVLHLVAAAYGWFALRTSRQARADIRAS